MFLQDVKVYYIIDILPEKVGTYLTIEKNFFCKINRQKRWIKMGLGRLF